MKIRWSKCLGLALLLWVLMYVVACPVGSYIDGQKIKELNENKVELTDKAKEILNKMEGLK